MPDEKALRRPGFVEGVAITLDDGQEWQLPRPMIEFHPVFDPDGGVSFGDRQLSFGPAYDAKVEAFLAAEDGSAQTNALLRLAVDLLGRNYMLEPAHYRELLPWRKDDDRNQAMWEDIAGIAVGSSPKGRTANG